MVTNLKNKKVLITAGPTWVKIDSVRVISNIATGETGILLADKLSRLGAKVTLLLGPVKINGLNNKVRLLRFRYFDELKSLINKELAICRYDLVIHSAAVSDYKPRVVKNGKITSNLEKLDIKLIPTQKIINVFKKMRGSLFLVGFKFEPGAGKIKLLKESRELIDNSGADLVVANTLKNASYSAYLVTKESESKPIYSKEEVVANLINAIK